MTGRPLAAVAAELMDVFAATADCGIHFLEPDLDGE